MASPSPQSASGVAGKGWFLAGRSPPGLGTTPPSGPGSRRADGPKTGHALTFKVDHLNRADQSLKYIILWGVNWGARSVDLLKIQ